jgi:hypothetical protein
MNFLHSKILINATILSMNATNLFGHFYNYEKIKFPQISIIGCYIMLEREYTFFLKQ